MHHSGLPFAIKPEREIHTHANLVLLIGAYAYKLKKPVKFPFLDYSTLELRRDMVLNELHLNRRFSPAHYLGVCEILHRGDALVFGPLCENLPLMNRDVVDYAVVMRRIDEADWLNVRIREQRISSHAIESLMAHLLSVYAASPTDPSIRAAGMPEQLRHNTVANIEQCQGFVPEYLSQERWQHLHQLLCGWFDLHHGIFESRVAGDYIREVHGDLKPGNIAFVGNQPVVTDCIEFDPLLRRLDVLCDISFLATGLEAQGAFAMAAHLYSTYQRLSGDQYPSSLRRYYQAHLACVMGKVSALQCQEMDVPLEQRQVAQNLSRHYFSLADFYASGPQVIAVMGIMGCGKSTVAQAIAARLGWPVKSSDIERKRLVGALPTQRLPDTAYSEDMTSRTYDALSDCVSDTFPGIVLDAQYPNQKLRRELMSTVSACGGRLLLVYCDAPDEVVKQRMHLRELQTERISDATADLLDEARRCFEVPVQEEGLTIVGWDTRGSKEEGVEKILEALLGPDFQPALPVR